MHYDDCIRYILDRAFERAFTDFEKSGEKVLKEERDIIWINSLLLSNFYL